MMMTNDAAGASAPASAREIIDNLALDVTFRAEGFKTEGLRPIGSDNTEKEGSDGSQ